MRLNPKMASVLGWLVGRGQRRPISSSIFLIVGAFILLTSIPGALFGTPYILIRAREVRALEQPSPEKLRVLPPYSEVLVPVTMPDKADASGLALSFVQVQKVTTTSGKSSVTWVAETPAQPLEVRLADGTILKLISTNKTKLIKAEELAPDSSTPPRRRVGYRPNAKITVEGTLNLDGSLTAQALYPGMPREYIRYLSWQPGAMLTAGMGCAGLGILLFAVGLILRYL